MPEAVSVVHEHDFNVRKQSIVMELSGGKEDVRRLENAECFSSWAAVLRAGEKQLKAR